MPAAVTMSINLSQMVMSRTLFLRPSGGASRPVSSAKRCLFEVDHEKNRQDLDAEMRIQEEKFKEKYNFDPRTDTPLHGRFEWVKVEEPSVAIEEATETRSTTSDEPVKNNDVPVQALTESKIPSQTATQTSITNYFPLRKRRAECKAPTSDTCKIRRSSAAETGH
ncbi:cyclin-dependent kinase inhibitor 1-like [Ornithodoros turicata]